ncbi:MAG: hypothetical protein WC333_07985 [Dehalococcoidia bacterium]|jgi:hypothetical protein
MKEDRQALNQQWQERKMILDILSQGAVSINDLIESIRERQSRLSALGQKVPSRPDNSAYMDWIAELKDTHLVIDNGSRLLLTPLGTWLLTSTCISTLKERFLYIKRITCGRCHQSGFVSVLKIRPDTAGKDTKSRMLVMTVECPKCRTVENRALSENLTASQFKNQYSLVLADLKKNVKFMPQLVLPV